MADPVEGLAENAQQKVKNKKMSSKSESKKRFSKTDDLQIVTDDGQYSNAKSSSSEPESTPTMNDADEKDSNVQIDKIDRRTNAENEEKRETVPLVCQEYIAVAIMPSDCDPYISATTEIATIPQISTVPKITTVQEVATISEITTAPEVSEDLGYEETELEKDASVPSARTRSPTSPYVVPPTPSTDVNFLLDIDEDKLIEMKEAFELFDMNSDGYIDHRDLKGTLVSLGQKVTDEEVKKMLSEATYPLDFDAFIMLLGYRSMELDPQETLVEALAQWDHERTGFISEKRIRHDLMTWGDRFTEREVDMAFEEAPMEQRKGRTMIDYVKFCKILCGLRKARKMVKN